MTETYTVRDWNEHFETAQSRKCASLNWVATPNKHDGKSYRRLMRMPDGVATYGCWMLILQVASKCPTRGILADADGPLTAEDISLKTDAPQALIERALEVLTSPQVGWLLVDGNHEKPSPQAPDYQSATTPLPADYQRSTTALPTHNSTEHNNTNTPLPPFQGDAVEDQKPKSNAPRNSPRLIYLIPPRSWPGSRLDRRNSTSIPITTRPAFARWRRLRVHCGLTGRASLKPACGISGGKCSPTPT